MRPDREEREEKDSELALSGPGGLGIRAKNYRVMDLVCLLTACGVIACAYYVRGYAGEYENQAKSIKESNEKIIQILKDNNEKTTDALNKQTDVLRRLNDNMKEGNCLNDPVLRNRQDAREVCRRLNGTSREDRR